MLSEAMSEIRFRLRALFRRERMERELDDELRFHIERDADEHARAGLGRDEALRRARMALGGIDRTKEETRDARGVMLLETLLQDLRYAVRGMRARPAFTAGVVLTLALGIGAASGLYALLDAVLDSGVQVESLPEVHVDDVVASHQAVQGDRTAVDVNSAQPGKIPGLRDEVFGDLFEILHLPGQPLD